jgi:hypothetical protein
MTQGTRWLTRHAGLVFPVGTFFVRESPDSLEFMRVDAVDKCGAALRAPLNASI